MYESYFGLSLEEVAFLVAKSRVESRFRLRQYLREFEIEDTGDILDEIIESAQTNAKIMNLAAQLEFASDDQIRQHALRHSKQMLKQIKRLMELKGLSAKDLARKCGLATSTISSILTQQSSATLEQLSILAYALGANWALLEQSC